MKIKVIDCGDGFGIAIGGYEIYRVEPGCLELGEFGSLIRALYSKARIAASKARIRELENLRAARADRRRKGGVL